MEIKNRLVRLVVTSLALGSLFSASASDNPSPAQGEKICIIPLLLASQELRDSAAPLLTKVSYTAIPGMPSAVLSIEGLEGLWIVNAARRLVPYEGFWPANSYLDRGHQAREPWTSRTVATTWGGVVSILPSGGDRFEEIAASDQISLSHGPFSTPFVLPRRKVTVVTTSDGSPFVVQDRTLAPWISADEMRRHGITGIHQVHESRVLDAEVVLDSHNRLHVLTDQDAWYDIASLGDGEFGKIADAPKSGLAIYLGQKSAVAITRNGNGFVGWTIANSYGNGVSDDFFISRLFGEAFYFGQNGFFDFHWSRWLRVQAKGLEDISGPSPNVPDDENYHGSLGHDLTAINRILFEGRESFFLYDGHLMVPVPGSERSIVGRWPRVSDLPSLGRVLISAEKGVFELTADGQLKKVATPFDGKGNEITEWRQARVGLIVDRGILYSIGRDMSFINQRLPVTSDKVAIYWVSPPNPQTGDVLILSSVGLFLAVTGPAATDHTCAQK